MLTRMAGPRHLRSVGPITEHGTKESVMGRTAIALGAALVVALGGCTAAPETDKSGGTPEPLRLTLGTPDHEGQPGADQVRAFLDEVDGLSEGRIEVDTRWEVSGDGTDDWDQVAARKVVDGELDLAFIPARAWDVEGVDSLRALHAPFLVTSEASLDAVVSSDLAVEMLAGLQDAGVTPLALLPEGFRFLFAFGDPARSLEDLRGRGVRAPYSATTYAVHEALGMAPDDPNGPAYAQAIVDGDVAVGEGAFSAPPEEPATAVGNLPLFPKLNTLVANTEAWDQLAEADQGILRQAAATVQQQTTETDLGAAELESAARFCESGTVIHWEPDEVGAAQAAVRPVYADLESDPVTDDLLTRLRGLVTKTSDSPVSAPPCSPDEPPVTAQEPKEGTGDQTVLDGTYRFTIPADYLSERGANDHEVAINSGVLTVTLDGGDYTINWRSPEEPALERGTYTVDGSDATFYLSWIPTGASPQGLPWLVNWRQRPDGDLVFTVDLEREPLIDAIFIAARWNRLR